MGLDTNWGSGGSTTAPRGAQRPSMRDIVNPLCGLTVAECKALPPDERFDGMRVHLANGRRYKFSAASALSADGDQLIIVPTSGSGRFLAEPGQVVDLGWAVDNTTADAATLYTLPTGAALLVRRGYWKVAVSFTGGSSSAIGLSSDQTPHNTKGDLHGGAGGDLAATLVSTGGDGAGNFVEGTVGADVAAGIILVGGKLVRFDRIVSNFAAGSGEAHLVCELLANPG